MKQHGFTLVELMIVLVILGILGALIGGAAFGGCGADSVRENAVSQAREFTAQMHPRWQNPRIVCQARDTDGNGYVRCTVVAEVPGAIPDVPREVTDDIECAAYWTWNRGCQATRMTIPNRHGQE